MKEYSREAERAFYATYQGDEVSDPDVLSWYIESFVAKPLVAFRGKTVLEIGAGRGQYSRLFRDRYGASRVVAIDLMWQQLVRDKEMNIQAGICMCAGDCFCLPFREGTFDLVFGSLVLHRFRNMSDVLKEVRRVLKPQGVYIGVEPALRNPAHLFRHLIGRRSANEFLVPQRFFLRAFASCSMDVHIQQIAPRHPWMRWLGLATALGITAKRIGG